MATEPDPEKTEITMDVRNGAGVVIGDIQGKFHTAIAANVAEADCWYVGGYLDAAKPALRDRSRTRRAVARFAPLRQWTNLTLSQRRLPLSSIRLFHLARRACYSPRDAASGDRSRMGDGR